MTQKIILFLVTLAFVSCGKISNEKPSNLIDKPTMEKILYDLALLQAIKGHDAKLLPKNKINPKTYIYQKYNIDSLQFAQSNTYYSSDISGYKKMYTKVIDKLTLEKKIVDSKLSKNIPIKPTSETGSMDSTFP